MQMLKSLFLEAHCYQTLSGHYLSPHSQISTENTDANWRHDITNQQNVFCTNAFHVYIVCPVKISQKISNVLDQYSKAEIYVAMKPKHMSKALL